MEDPPSAACYTSAMIAIQILSILVFLFAL